MLGIPWGTEEQHIWVKTTDLFSKINRTWTEIYQSTIKYFHNFFAQRILSDLIEKTSLRPALMSRKWWTRLLLVRDTVWSRALCRFFVMNAGISKRNNNLAEYGALPADGRVVECPRCKIGPSTEIEIEQVAEPGHLFNFRAK